MSQPASTANGDQPIRLEDEDFPTRMFASFGDELTSRMAGHLCALSYFDSNAISRKLQDTDLFVAVEFVERDSVFYFIVEARHYTAIIFRGTFNRLGWMTNIDIRVRQTAFGPIHNGVAKDFFNIQETVFKTKITLHRNKRIYIAGHSKGGALASLCAIFLLEMAFQE